MSYRGAVKAILSANVTGSLSTKSNKSMSLSARASPRASLPNKTICNPGSFRCYASLIRNMICGRFISLCYLVLLLQVTVLFREWQEDWKDSHIFFPMTLSLSYWKRISESSSVKADIYSRKPCIFALQKTVFSKSLSKCWKETILCD